MATIVGRMLAFARERSHGVKWILSLSEKHHSIYGERVDDQVRLMIQNPDAQMIAAMTVGKGAYIEWVESLRANAD